MSSPFTNPGPHKPRNLDWAARLIPGVASPSPENGRKPPRSLQSDVAFPALWSSRPPDGAAKETVSEAALTLLVPGLLQSRSTGNWLRSVSADFALVGINWLLVGVLTFPLHEVFRSARVFEHPLGTPAPLHLLGIALLHAVLITLVGCCEGLYTAPAKVAAQARCLGRAVFWGTALLCLTYQLEGAPLRLIVVICGAALLHFGALLTWRWTDLKWQRRTGCSRTDARNVLIVGAGGVGRRVAAYMKCHPEEGRTVCGFLDDERPMGNGVIGPISKLARLARRGFVDEVILAAPRDRDVTLRVLHEARRLRLDVEMVPDLFGWTPAGNGVGRIGDLPAICLRRERPPVAGLCVKRALDIVGASAVLLISAPALIAIAALIKLTSPGPAIYVASRAGRKGRLFRCYKFRTMVSNADVLKNDLRDHNQRSGPCFKIAADPRITRLGRFLRRYSLDEFPQFWNVLKGDMSLVGPRPHPLDDYAAYEVEHLARLDVTPGITGLWQVTARRDPSFQRGIELDREYIRDWSLGMDMRILFRTFLAVVRGSGD